VRLLAFLQPQWKHPDPAIRAQAVRKLSDANRLETMAVEDPSEAVRLAAFETLQDDDALARLARGSTPLAVPAVRRLQDRTQLAAVAQMAEQREARELAIERIDDRALLNRIAVCDTDPWVRLKARLKTVGPDHARDLIKRELGRLAPSDRAGEAGAEFSGTLDDVCRALLGDERFRINAGVQRDPGPATAPAESETTLGAPTCAHFLAQKRGTRAGDIAGPSSAAFFEITVWRTAADRFHGCAVERRLQMCRDAEGWSRASRSESTSPVGFAAVSDESARP
jgi:hypothetical protein